MQIPRYSQQVQTVAQPGFHSAVGLPSNPIPNAIAGVGTAIGNVGKALSDITEKELDKRNTIEANEAKRDIMDQYSKTYAWSNTVKGRGVLPGYDESGNPQSDAQDLVEQGMSEFGTYATERMSKMSPAAREKLGTFVDDRIIGLNQHLLTRQATESENYYRTETLATAGKQHKALLQTTDPAAFNKGVAELRDTLQGLYQGEELNQKMEKLVNDALYQQVESAVRQNPSTLDAFKTSERYKVLSDDDWAKLDQTKRSQMKVIAEQQQDGLNKEVILPALQKKQFVAGLADNPRFAAIVENDASRATGITNSIDHYNAGLAWDNYEKWAEDRKVTSLGQVDKQILSDLRTYNPSAYNRLAKNLDDEKELRRMRAEQNRQDKANQASMLLNVMLNPKSINSSQLISDIYAGRMPADLGMKILDTAEKFGNISGELEKKQYAERIDREADYMVAGIKDEKKRKEIKKLVVGNLVEDLSDLFTSTVQVTPKTVDTALHRMRTAIMQKPSIMGGSYGYAASINSNDQNFTAPKDMSQMVSMYARQKNITEAAATRKLLEYKALGIDITKLLSHGGQ